LHFANGAFRFALELAALASLGAWGLAQAEGGVRYVPMIALPLGAATLVLTPGVNSKTSASRHRSNSTRGAPPIREMDPYCRNDEPAE
jgi:hypothetical protein